MRAAQMAGGAAAVAVVALWGLWALRAPAAPPAALPAASSTPPFVLAAGGRAFSAAPGIEVRYRDDTRPFSFGLPAGFSAQAYPAAPPGAEAVLVAGAAGDGLLIQISPAPGAGPALSAADVARIAPALEVDGSVSFPVAPGADGLAFEAQDPVWNGPAAELWFIYGGDRYEISAPAADAGLIDFIWSSWIWERAR
jgi:hypothetical protein